jgi:hypothetical protein
VKRALVFVLLTACGGANPEPRAVVVAPENKRPAPIAEPPPEANRTTIEYVVVPVSWVEKVAATPAADVKAWGEVPENRRAIRTASRHILFQVLQPSQDDAQRKKAEQTLARLAKGDDFAKLAKQLSDDPGTKDKGGLVPADMLDKLVQPYKDAYASLAPGETVKQPVKTTFGWHIIKKDLPTEDDLASAYKKAKAPELAKKLADEILARMRTADSTRAAIASAVETILGDDAKENADRPHALLVVDKNVPSLHMPEEAKEAIANLAKTGRTGEVAKSPIASKNAFVAARVASAPTR